MTKRTKDHFFSPVCNSITLHIIVTSYLSTQDLIRIKKMSINIEPMWLAPEEETYQVTEIAQLGNILVDQ